jgi:hypothetical protein
MIIVTLPFYLIFGRVPSDKIVLFVLSIITIIGMFYMIRQIFKKFKTNTSYILYLFFNCSVVFGSMTYLLLRLGSYYILAISTAIACMAWSIGFAYAAVCNKNKISRSVLFLLSGIFLVLVSESRPSSIILEVGAIAPLFISVLIDKSRKWKSRLIDAFAFLFPVILGGLAIMYYNYIRFDSVFEFGLTYQLTVRDISYDQIRFSPKKIFSAIYYSFFRPLNIIPQFPYFIASGSNIRTNGNYFYNEMSAGIFIFPFAWGVFALPFMNKKEKILEKITYITMLGAAVFIAVFDYVKSGIIQRYLSEVSFIVMIVAGMALLNRIKNNEKWKSIVFIIMSIVTILMSIVVVIIFDYIRNYQPENINYLLQLRDFFSLG